MTSEQKLSFTPFRRVLLLWLAVVTWLATSGRLSALQPPLPQLLIVALTVALVVAGAVLPGFRDWLAHVSLRAVVAFHVTRYVGIAFLVLHARGQLPTAFALPAGWGDILVATLAIPIVLFLPHPASRPRLLMLWNALGLADILGAVFSATRLSLANPDSMRALLHFPLSLVPTFLVPLIIASHLLVFSRLRKLAAAIKAQP